MEDDDYVREGNRRGARKGLNNSLGVTLMRIIKLTQGWPSFEESKGLHERIWKLFKAS